MKQVAAATVNAEASPVNRLRPPRDWHIDNDHHLYAPLEAAARDATVAQAVANGAAPTFRLWQSGPALAVSRQDLQLPRIAQAMTQMNDAGWPVVERATGGTAVPLSPGVLNVSMIVPRSFFANTPGFSIDAVYRLLCAPVQQALTSMRIETCFGSVPGTFCDGRFNLVSGGQKIAGTAQVWRANVAAPGPKREGYVLAHAALFVDVDPYVLTETVNRFYGLAGKAVQFSAKNLTTVRHSLTSASDRTIMDDVRSRIVSGIESGAAYLTL